MNHIRAVKAWVEAHHGQAQLDLLSFELEVKARHRYFHLQPQFLASIDGRLGHVGQLSPEVTGFIGWLPYRPIRFPLSSDKLAFKRFLADAGLPTPAVWPSPERSESDFILKRSVGSFGYDMAGPFQRQSSVDPATASAFLSERPGHAGTTYVEQFVTGRNLKVWCWGEHPFHVHLHPYPSVVGDGQQTVSALIDGLFRKAGQVFETSLDRPFIEQSLRYQQADPGQVLDAGRSLWIDFRYGRRFVQQETSEATDNAWPSLPPGLRAQVQQAAARVSAELCKQVQVPVLYSLDGVVDRMPDADAGGPAQVRWLEMNSNPIFPPTGYQYMLATLFDTPMPVETVSQHIPPAAVNAGPASVPFSAAEATQP